MSLLTGYLIGFVVTAIFVNYRSPSKVRSSPLVAMSLVWPLTWIAIVVINVRAMVNPEFREYAEQLSREYEEDDSGR